MNSFVKEAVTQGAVLKDFLNYYQNEGAKILEETAAFFANGYQEVLLTGMGSSYYAPFSVVDFLVTKGIPSTVLNSFEVVRYQFDLIEASVFPVLISQSGKSKEVLELQNRLTGKDREMLCLVNKEDSQLAANSSNNLYIKAGAETQISNKSYLCTLAVLDLLVTLLAKEDLAPVFEDMDRIADWMVAYLDDAPKHAKSLLAFSDGASHFDFIGNGPSMSTALQAGLIFREGPTVTTGAINCADYAHGWDRCVAPGYVGVILAPDYRPGTVEERMVASILERGGKVILITSTTVEPAERLLVVSHPSVPDRLAPMAQIIPCNMLMGWLMGEKSDRE